MPTAEIKETINGSTNAVFALFHNYRRRLEWDTLLQEAYLEPEFKKAALGAISVCRGKWFLGGFALRTEYVSFVPDKVTAVKLLNQPPFFETFAASVRHVEIETNRSEIIYKLSFLAKPSFARPILHPLMRLVLVWETRRRLRALKNFFESDADSVEKPLA